MSIAYKSRKEATELAVGKGETFGAVLDKKGLRAQWELVGQYNWGTKEPAEINRALIELVGCEEFGDDPLDTVLDPGRGTGGKIYQPETWTPTLDVNKVHTVTVKKRLAVPGVCIEGLTALFEPGADPCEIDYLLEGDPERVKTADLEVHVASYWALTGRSSGSVPKPDVEEFVTSYYDEVKAEDDRHLAEYVEKPTGTFTEGAAKETHILRKSKDLPRGTAGFVWDGKSKATEGVLKADALINSRCAPYLVSVRYYKDPADKTAILRLKPFYPQWKLTGKKKWDLIEGSMIVEWKVEGEETSKAKLKNGQIRLYDESDLVFFAPLTADQIKAGKYDLLNEAIKWNKSKVDMKKLPYRIQIQVHSDDEMDNGLALAVMPTQVPAYNYESVQFIAHDACNDTNAGIEYLGDSDDDADISFRVEAMIEAIQKAKPGVDPDPTILKVFMAPEFYFRGEKGAYSFEKISTIVPKLRKETDKYDYLDWWFVFGTALGSHNHGATGSATEHGNAIHLLKINSIDSATEITAKVWSAPKQGWELHTQNGQKKTISGPPVWPVDLDKLKFPSRVKLTLSDTTGLVTTADKIEAWVIEPVMTILDTDPTNTSPTDKIIVASAICSQIAVEPVTNKVIAVGGTHWEAVSEGASKNITAKRITHVEFDGVRKQFTLTLDSPAPFLAGKPLVLREPKTVEIFNAALMQKGWNAPHLGDGSLREVITYKEDMSHVDYIRDIGITDSEYYDPSGAFRRIRMNKAYFPFLPTAGGKDIGGASPNIVRQPGSNVGSEINETGLGGGCVVMVDRVTFGIEVCRDHCVDRLFNFYTGPNVRAGDPLAQVQLIPSWGMSIGTAGAGKEVTALRNALVFNVDGPRMNPVARVWDTTYSCDKHVTVSEAHPGNCTHPYTTMHNGRVWYECYQHGAKVEFYENTACPQHGAATCDKPLQQMGTALTAATPIDVPKSNNAKYFKGMGNVRVFPVAPLPDADVATTPPTLNGITNDTRQQGLSIEVTLKGSGLSHARYVKVDGGGVTMTAISVVSDAEVKATLSVDRYAAVGARNLTVSSLSGTSATSVVFNVAPLVPAIISITPNEGRLLGDYDVEIVGTNFLTCTAIVTSDPGVTWTFVSLVDDKIKLKINVAANATLGAGTITVTTSGGSASGVFTVKAGLPVVHSVSKQKYPVDTNQMIQITGLHLQDATDAVIKGGGVEVDFWNADSDFQMNMAFAVAADAVIGNHNLVVTTPAGDSLPFIVTVCPPEPELDSVSPGSPKAAHRAALILTGSNLAGYTAINISGNGITQEPATVKLNDRIELPIKLTADADPTEREITVTTPSGKSNVVKLTVNPCPPPTIDSISVNRSRPGKGELNIKGSDLVESGTITCSTAKIYMAHISRPNTSRNQLKFQIWINADAPIGIHKITYTNRFGSATVDFEVIA